MSKDTDTDYNMDLNTDPNMNPNSDAQIKIRRLEDILRCGAMGILIFGVWSIIRLSLMIFTKNPRMLIELEGYTASEDLVNAVYYGTIAIICIIDMLIKFYLFRRVHGVIKGTYTGNRMIAVIFTLVIISLAASLGSIGYEFKNYFELELISSAFIELTSDVIFLEVAIATIRIRHLRKNLLEQ